MSDNSRWVLDLTRLDAALVTVARHRGMSDKDVARETGLSPSTITRIGQGQKPDADGLVSLLKWLGIDVSTFARRRVDHDGGEAS